MSHDPLCPASAPDVCQCALCDPYCVCDIIDGVRGDEREKVIQRQSGWMQENVGGTYPFGTITQGLFAAVRGADEK